MVTADVIARAIVAASRELNADPLAVARGDKDPVGDETYAISRARAYAAFALKGLLDISATKAAIYCGVIPNYAPGYFASKRGVGWWDLALLARVVDAVRPHLTQDDERGDSLDAERITPKVASAEVLREFQELPSLPPGGLLRRPIPGERFEERKRAFTTLEEALRNTAEIQRRQRERGE